MGTTINVAEAVAASKRKQNDPKPVNVEQQEPVNVAPIAVSDRLVILSLPKTAQRRVQTRDNGTADYFLAVGHVEIVAGSGVMAPAQVKRHKLADGTIEERATLKTIQIAPGVWRQYLEGEGAAGEKNIADAKLAVMAAYDKLAASVGAVGAEAAKVQADPATRKADTF